MILKSYSTCGVGYGKKVWANVGPCLNLKLVPKSQRILCDHFLEILNKV
ncbi:hypothetical protein LEP1GSC013_1341 [Leptospira interrogans serovar Valbuzzi str. Duyster]|nr:hypothetical protein LEP1GSC013_1341 [Leptospira interrogans serovar Valbuzzi str. Duyster]ENO70244.1 hypothetical protein LEP1GSC012_4064 [Leptospira interrogans serovar Valbuzzi str. Valbuzzi]